MECATNINCRKILNKRHCGVRLLIYATASSSASSLFDSASSVLLRSWKARVHESMGAIGRVPVTHLLELLNVQLPGNIWRSTFDLVPGVPAIENTGGQQRSRRGPSKDRALAG